MAPRLRRPRCGYGARTARGRLLANHSSELSYRKRRQRLRANDLITLIASVAGKGALRQEVYAWRCPASLRPVIWACGPRGRLVRVERAGIFSKNLKLRSYFWVASDGLGTTSRGTHASYGRGKASHVGEVTTEGGRCNLRPPGPDRKREDEEEEEHRQDQATESKKNRSTESFIA
eukprot:scaffold343_cov245-Pinguiococcus_pyrenoidosus.AAC.14